eukprot:GHVO01018423.1.p4 GENE.GHVO01018423.1~~GHVO01018423.1.p4  ORF type:complete len:159 (+),score=38.05 GHVO01018423.1:1582-2058(+)
MHSFDHLFFADCVMLMCVKGCVHGLGEWVMLMCVKGCVHGPSYASLGAHCRSSLDIPDSSVKDTGHGMSYSLTHASTSSINLGSHRPMGVEATLSAPISGPGRLWISGGGYTDRPPPPTFHEGAIGTEVVGGVLLIGQTTHGSGAHGAGGLLAYLFQL